MTEEPVLRLGTVDQAEYEKMQSKMKYLSFALEDALAELVKDRGEPYLDVFFERRVRRTSEQDLLLMEIVENHGPKIAGLREYHEALMQAGLDSLRTVIENVRRDPSTVD